MHGFLIHRFFKWFHNKVNIIIHIFKEETKRKGRQTAYKMQVKNQTIFLSLEKGFAAAFVPTLHMC